MTGSTMLERADAEPRGTEHALELRGISKAFGDVQANRDVSLAIRRGEIHGIVGENGAGKSTLMSIIYGFYEADSGEIAINGRTTRIATSSDAIAAGIGMVHQHFMLIEPFTVLENIMLGAEGGATLGHGMRQARAELTRLQREYQLDVPVDKYVRDLPIGVQQRVEILKALYRRAEILILDEPTGVLTPSEADHLFKVLNSMRSQGKTIVLITHKLREIMAVTDSVSVMRQGQVVARRLTAETSQEELAELMVGRTVEWGARPGQSHAGKVLLEARGLNYFDEDGVARLKDVSLHVRAGEIVGIAGVSGNGQSELLSVLAGLLQPTSGDVEVSGVSYATLPQVDARTVRGLRVGHIPEDRHREGLVTAFDASECSILGWHREPEFNGRLLSNRSAIVEHARELMSSYDVRPPIPSLRAANFSGGNQQKLIIGREVERDPLVLLVGQPTRGVDVGAIESIHKRLLAMRAEGKALLVVSVELDEIFALSDRILVMFDGAIVGELSSAEANEQNLGLLMAGVQKP